MGIKKFVVGVILILGFTGVGSQPDQNKDSACQDEYPDGCSIEVDRCSSNDSEILKTMRQICPVTCKTCNTVGDQTSNQNNEEIIEETKIIDSSTRPCEDKYTRCVTLKSVCGSSKLFRETHCRKTCDQCTPQSTTPKKVTTVTTTVSTLIETLAIIADNKVCQDKFESCKHLDIQKLCKDPEHIEQLSTYCAKTCGFCSTCEDKYPETCQSQKETCTIGDAETVETMRILCPATCGTCGRKSSSKDQQCADKYPETCQTQKDSCTVGDAESVATMRQLCPVTCNTCGKESSSKNRYCVDKYPEQCLQQMAQCTGSDEETMRRLCPVTCGTCDLFSQADDNAISTTKSVTTSPTTGKDCVDQYPETCLQQKQECTSENAETRQAMRQRCPVTCGTCAMHGVQSSKGDKIVSTITIPVTDSTQRTVAPSCTNDILDETCRKYRKLCNDISSDWKNLCRATCGNCDKNKNPGPTVTTPSDTSPIATNPPMGQQNVDNGPRIESKSECRDQIKECPLHPHLCSIEDSGWKDACFVTCNTCKE